MGWQVSLQKLSPAVGAALTSLHALKPLACVHSLRALLAALGPLAPAHSILVFTRGDELEADDTPLYEFLRDSPPYLKA